MSGEYLRSAMEGAGAGLVVVALWMIWVPAALLVLGVMVMLVANFGSVVR